MIAELRLKSQITIPKAITQKLGINIGDKLEIREENGDIRITPVVVYPKNVVEELQKESIQAKKDLKAGKLKAYKTVDALIEALKES